MKKVLFVESSLGIGGIEKSLVDWLNVLAMNKELQIDLLLYAGQEINKKYKISSSISIVPLPKYYSFAFGSFRDKLKQKPISCLFSIIRCIIAATPEKLRSKCSYSEAIRNHYINKMCEIEKQYDVCVAYSDGAPLYFAINKIKYSKLITFIHAEISTFKVKKKEKYEKVDIIACVSKQSADSIRKFYPSQADKVTVIHNLTDSDYIKTQADLQQSDFDQSFFNILSVGRLTPQKNYVALVDCFAVAFPQLSKKCRLYIVGDGYDKNNIQNEIDKKGLNESVILLGAKENPYPYMKHCDLYVQPSVMEGYGLTIKEAYELRCPILATNVGVVPELIKNGYNGVIADDWFADFSSKLVQLVNDDNLRQNIKNNIQENDTNETSIAILKDILRGS